MPLADLLQRKKRIILVLLLLLLSIFVGLLIPERARIPVAGATKKDWNHQTFWHYPWGKSGVHKGIDIFAPLNTNVTATVTGLVIYTGQLGIGGNVVLLLGPKWRLHYYAHLQETLTSAGTITGRGETIGTIGKTGNAQNRPPHLHYSILTIIPYPWRIDGSRQGWKKMFFLDPTTVLLAN